MNRPNYEAELTAIAIALGAVNPDAEGTERPTAVTMAGMIRQQIEWAASLQSDLMQVAGALGVLKPSSVNVGAYERPNVSAMLAELEKRAATSEAKQRWVLSEIAGALGMWKPGDELPTSTKIAGVITTLLDEAPPPVGRGPVRTWASQGLEDIAIALGLWKLEQGPDAMPTAQAMIARITALQRAVHDQSTRSVVTGRSGKAPAAEYFPPNEGIRVKDALKFICKELATSEQLGEQTRTVFAEAHRHLIGDAPIPGGA